MSGVSAIRQPDKRKAAEPSDDEVRVEGLGIAVLVPGWMQWLNRERERGLILFGTFSSALFVGLCAWGTWLGTTLLVFAFLAHVLATADALRRGTFPPFERWVPWMTAGLGLGLGCYAPFMIAGLLLAWPGMRSDSPFEGYLVDRWTLSRRAPTAGDHVWVESDDGRGPWLGRVIAVSGQNVKWSEERLRIDRLAVEDRRGRFPGRIGELEFQVPDDHLLIVAEATPVAGSNEQPSPRIVPSARIVGLAWAKYYPIWERRLL